MTPPPLTDFFYENTEGKIISRAKEHNNKEYWARKLWSNKYEWLLDEQNKMKEENQKNFQDLYSLLDNSSKDPYFNGKLSKQIFVQQIPQKHSDIENNKWPAFPCTTNRIYGRFGYQPLEAGGEYIKRPSYSKYRKIGGWLQKYDKVIIKE